MQEFLQNKLQDRLISFTCANQGVPINDIGTDISVPIEMIVTKIAFLCLRQYNFCHARSEKQSN